MTSGKHFTFFVISLLFLGLASTGLSAGMGEEVKGTVTKIDGGKVSIKDLTGGEKTIEPTNPDALTGLKVGDRVSVKDGILKKESGAGPPTPSPRPGY
ncbi:MAG: hypothetical protein H6Q79_1620 [Deltaproteobacteria bacterium]|jgi:hypothetical protein|nr:hypothetical protein [Deltaproteobacteria bacterium]MBP2686249.1 hypothetical protein [Deltaproteobacteria bacterium]